MAYYATRTQSVAANVQENQLMKFGSRKDRDNYCAHEDAQPISAADAGKLTIADVWRGVQGRCVFHVARYI